MTMTSESQLRREFEKLEKMLRATASEHYDPHNSMSRSVSPEGVKLYNRLSRRFKEYFPSEDLMIFREDTTPNIVMHPKCLEILSQVESALDFLRGGVAETRIEISPIFSRREFAKQNGVCFVLMPFLQELKPVYDDHIKKAVTSSGLSCKRADDFFNVSSIIEDIWEHIYTARLLIADLTEKNPNVFYELGVAHTLGREVILITQNIDDVPFDLRHLRHIRYDYTPRGMQLFEQQLSQSIAAVLGTRRAGE